MSEQESTEVFEPVKDSVKSTYQGSTDEMNSLVNTQIEQLKNKTAELENKLYFSSLSKQESDMVKGLSVDHAKIVIENIKNTNPLLFKQEVTNGTAEESKIVEGSEEIPKVPTVSVGSGINMNMENTIEKWSDFSQKVIDEINTVTSGANKQLIDLNKLFEDISVKDNMEKSLSLFQKENGQVNH